MENEIPRHPNKNTTMTSEQILRSDVLDILFENRNKNYGAYELRKFYPARLSAATLSSISVVALLLLFFSPQYEKNFTLLPDPADSGWVVRTFPIPPEIAPPPPPPPPRNIRSSAPQVQHVTIRITEDHKVTDVPEQAEMVDRFIAGTTTDGDPAALPQAPVPVVEAAPPPAAAESFVPSYTAPEFPGGLSAWMHFLNRNLRVPESLAPGEKKSVRVRFQVGADGSVSGFNVVQSAGAGFDAEVIRVLKKMPKWKPAIQNGHPTIISFTQPVTFVGLEE